MSKTTEKETRKAKLTKRAVDALVSEPVEYFVWDTELTGFAIRVYPTGTRTYFIQYRSGGGRERRYKVGRHGQLTPDEARKEARRRLGEVACGDDPSGERQRVLKAPTVRELAERFLEDHVSLRCKPSTQRNYRQQVRSHILPRIGTMKVADVTRTDIANLHHAMRGTPHQANRVVAVLSKMFNLAELWGWRRDGSNPCRLIPKNKEKPKDRFLSPDELARLSAVLCEVEEDGSESWFVTAAIRLLILTGCRHSEIQKLRWDEVRDGYLQLRDSKTGARRIPLPSEAVDILASLPRSPGNPFVIEGKWTGTHLTDLQRPWRRIRGLAGLEDVRIHDLRHTFASIAVQNGIDLLTVGKLLGHASYMTTQRYAHLADEPIRRAGQQVSGLVSDMMLKTAPRQSSHLRIVK